MLYTRRGNMRCVSFTRVLRRQEKQPSFGPSQYPIPKNTSDLVHFTTMPRCATGLSVLSFSAQKPVTHEFANQRSLYCACFVMW